MSSLSSSTIFRVEFRTYEKKFDQVQVEFEFFNRVVFKLDFVSTRLHP